VTDKPKEPSRFDPHESDYPRAVTPPEAWDSRPKIAVAKPVTDPVDPFASIPRIPRAPHVPSDVGDTDRAPPIAPNEQDHRRSEETPVKHILSPMDQLCLDVAEMRQHFSDVRAIKDHCRSSADSAMMAVEVVRELRDDTRALAARMAKIETIAIWVPLGISLISLAMSVVSIAVK